MLKLLLPLVTVLFAILCSGPVLALEKVVATETYAEVNKVKNYIRMVDNVVILFDTSGSMTDPYQASGKTKLQVAKDLLKQRVEVFPDVFPEINVGLYSYSPPIGVSAEEASGRGYDVFYKMQPFDKAAFLEAVDSLPTETDGPTLIQNALSRLDDLLEKLSGPHSSFYFYRWQLLGHVT